MDFSAINTVWVLLGTTLIFFMQGGFCMLEAGFTSSKNTGNIVMKNLIDFCIGAPVFWLVGFGLMYGGTGSFIGSFNGIASEANYGNPMMSNGIPFLAFLFFQTGFCATSATIVSGAMAERTKFSAYCIYSLVISMLIYPVSGHWIWGNGWLKSIGFHDFAGGSAVHTVGGISALIGAALLGPRIGKYDKNKRPRALPGHSLTISALGIFILWFCWFGFNGASTTGISSNELIGKASKILVVTNLTAAVSTVTAMLVTWVRYKKPDISMTLNSALAGLVSSTACCDTVSPVSAVIIGILAGFCVVFSVEFVDKKLHIDDPVGAFGAHGICGILGTLCVGLLSDGTGTFSKGILTGGGNNGVKLFCTQFLGSVSVIIWTSITVFILFSILKKTIGLRVTETEELLGLDVSEHGLTGSYNGYPVMPDDLAYSAKPDLTVSAPASINEAVTIDHLSENASHPDAKLTKITVICKQNKFEDLKSALNAIGVTGITVTNVLGCGAQKGATELYRGVSVDLLLLPKIKVDIVVSAIPVEIVVKAIKESLFTGHIGDGKIFLYDVENVIRVRTNEEGYDALQREN